MAVLIQSSISKNTSFGDLACIVYNKKVLYKKFDVNLDVLKRKSIIEQLNTDWAGLIIKPIDLDINFLIVHTKSESKSYDLVSKVTQFKDIPFFKTFIQTSNNLVNKLVNDFSIYDIKKLHENFLFLEKNTGLSLITEEMLSIKSIISSFNGIMKFSGAGGGDMVICFFENNHLLLEAKKALEINAYEYIIYGGEYES